MIPAPWELQCFSLNIVGWRLLLLYKNNGINQSLQNKLKPAIFDECKAYKILNNTGGGLQFLWDQLEVESHVILSELP